MFAIDRDSITPYHLFQCELRLVQSLSLYSSSFIVRQQTMLEVLEYPQNYIHKCVSCRDI